MDSNHRECICNAVPSRSAKGAWRKAGESNPRRERRDALAGRLPTMGRTFRCMASREGFEPSTHGVGTRRSTRLSYRLVVPTPGVEPGSPGFQAGALPLSYAGVDGGRQRSRTPRREAPSVFKTDLPPTGGAFRVVGRSLPESNGS